ncbi:MAG: AraC family transcriptional regulator [Spirochaetaceae bacterium]|nr:MAG: AraC family transcriptional regulator [Spirochaetaceae bacterium]
MDPRSFFYEETCFVPYVSFVIHRPRFTRWKVKERTIEDHELVLIADGEGVLRIDREILPLKKGTLLYLHYDQWHSMEARADSMMSFYSVHFSWMLATHSHESWSYHKEINYYLKDEVPAGQNWSVIDDPGLLPFPSTMTLSNYDRIEDLYIRLNRAYHEKGVGYAMELSILCQRLVQEVCREHFFPADRKINIKRLDCVLEFIHRHYTEKIRTEDLCECANLSESNLIKLFRKNLGRTPIDYINQVRVNRAKELLLHTDLNVKEIAWETGFADQFYFSRVFKKMEGKSPRDFRHQMLS